MQQRHQLQQLQQQLQQLQQQQQRRHSDIAGFFLFFFCQLSVGLVPLILQMEGNRPKGITVALMAPVGLAVTSLGALSQQPEAEGQRPVAWSFHFFCHLSVVLVPLRLPEEGNRPEGITAALRVPVGLAGRSLGPLSPQPEAGGQRPLA